MNIIISLLIVLTTFLGGNYALDKKVEGIKQSSLDADWLNPPLRFGAITYPGSLDSLENPGTSQSVATTKTHSQQHSDANDAIESLQAKLGISASTAITNSILAGNGSGSSIWTTFATTTNITATGQGVFGSFISQASSTVLGDLNITGNSTTTNATTTNFYSTTASTTNFYGGGLSSCTGVNFLQWTAGQFGCDESGGGGVTLFSTTTAQNLATTTISSAELPTGDSLSIMVSVPNIVGHGATSTAQLIMSFDSDVDANNYVTSRIIGASHGSISTVGGVFLYSAGADPRFQRYARINISNVSGNPKMGDVSSIAVGTSSPITSTGNFDGTFVWASATKATNIKLWWDQPNVYFGTSTAIRIIGY